MNHRWWDFEDLARGPSTTKHGWWTASAPSHILRSSKSVNHDSRLTDRLQSGLPAAHLTAPHTRILSMESAVNDIQAYQKPFPQTAHQPWFMVDGFLAMDDGGPFNPTYFWVCSVTLLMSRAVLSNLFMTSVGSALFAIKFSCAGATKDTYIYTSIYIYIYIYIV